MNHCYFTIGGSVRAESPATTLRRLQPQLARFGITRLADITHLDIVGMPVVICIRPNARHLAVSQGKGKSKTCSAVSAIMESIETYHAEHPPEHDYVGAYNQLKSDFPVINPERFSQGVVQKSKVQGQSLSWIKARNMLNQKMVYVPHALCNFNSTNLRHESSFFNVSSNGLASGNTREEALCHAIFEIIERNALSHWGQQSLANKALNQIKIDTLDSENRALAQRFIEHDIKLKVWEITDNIGVPVYHCAIYDPSPMRKSYVHTGTGCHLDKHIALCRALLEAAQARLAVISGSRDDIFPSYYDITHCPIWQKNTGGVKDFQQCQTVPLSGNLSTDLMTIIGQLDKAGYQDIYYIDHTKIDLDIPVVQVFIPGLKFSVGRM